jgi:hypothetical protein
MIIPTVATPPVALTIVTLVASGAGTRGSGRRPPRTAIVPVGLTVADPIVLPDASGPSTIVTRWPAKIDDRPVTRHSPLLVRYLAMAPVNDSAKGETTTVSVDVVTQSTPVAVKVNVSGELFAT